MHLQDLSRSHETVHKVLALYLSRYFIIVISYYFHKLHSLVNANVRVYRLWPS